MLKIGSPAMKWAARYGRKKRHDNFRSFYFFSSLPRVFRSYNFSIMSSKCIGVGVSYLL
ncbi:hypothetical protein V6Z11_D10G286900 [Gossypium hirsutum]